MIPTLLVVGLVIGAAWPLGRATLVALLVASAAFAAAVVLGGDPSFGLAAGAFAVALVNGAVGVAIGAAGRWAVRAALPETG